MHAFQNVLKQPNFHLIFKNIGFEMFFKHAIKKYGAKMEVSKSIGELFLAYTEELCRNKHQLFEMFETIKCFLNNIDYYYILE